MIAVTDAGYLAQIHETACLAQIAATADAMVDHVCKQLIGVLDLKDCRFEYGKLIGHLPRLDQDGVVRAGYGRVGFERPGLPGQIELRTFSGGQYYGRFILTTKPEISPSLQARLTAVTLADLAGQALGTRRSPEAR